MMHIGPILDTTINLGNPPKVFLKEWLQNNCLSVIFSGVNNNISSKKQLLPCRVFHIMPKIPQCPAGKY